MSKAMVTSPAPRSAASLIRGRWLLIVVIIAIATAELVVAVSETWVFVRSDGRVFAMQDAPPAPIAIVFGAQVSDDEPGPYLKGRLDTALGLFDDGLVETIVVSGDATPPDDDEVAVMRNYLQDRGIPPERLIEDPRGFDTDDTCRRARTVYRVHRALLVTQDFHTPRAVALCRAWQIDAFGVVAGCDCSERSLIRNYVREVFLSRPAAFIYALRA
jgi:vancomycin permeability regulator SanA